jgi:hypothetical protein
VATNENRSNGGRIISLPQISFGANPNGAPPQAPHIRLASKAPNGLPTTGFLFSLYDVTGGVTTPTAPGFIVQIWLWNPVAQRWQSFAAKTAVNFDELYESYDVDGGCELYFQITNIAAGAGNIGVSVCEQ